MRITEEPRVYGPGSAHCYFLDVAASVQTEDHTLREAADERLNRYAAELKVEERSATPEGRHSKRSAREHSRNDDPTQEVRALTTGSASGGAFVTPSYVNALWASIAAGTVPSLTSCSRVTCRTTA